MNGFKIYSPYLPTFSTTKFFQIWYSINGKLFIQLYKVAALYVCTSFVTYYSMN